MQHKRVSQQWPQFKLFEAIYALILTNRYFQIIQRSNSLDPNKAMDKCIYLIKPNNKNKQLYGSILFSPMHKIEVKD